MNSQHSVFVGEFCIHLLNGKIFVNEKNVPIRPKTFEVLAYFLERPKQIISKDAFLNDIWDDVNVDEQVIIQSVKELRKIFANKEIIKTHPRKGYSWVAPVELSEQLLTAKVTDDLHQEKEFMNGLLRQSMPRLPYWFFGFASLMLVVFGGVHLFQNDNTGSQLQAEPSVIPHGALVVLPVYTDLEGAEYQWVKYGAMDQVIKTVATHCDLTCLAG